MPAPRERILAEAAALFARAGYENSSMGDLAACTGVSKAALYHYFPTKQAIYDAIILDVLAGLTESVGADIRAHADPTQRLRSFMLAHARYFEARHAAFVTMLIGYSGMSPNLRADAAALRDGYEALLRELIADGIARGAFRAANPATVGRAILSMLNWMARWYKPGQAASAEAVAAEYFDLIMGGLQTQRGPVTGDSHGPG